MIELMIAVSIVGILGALAAPSFMRYIKKAKTAEAYQGVKRIYDGARAYFHNPPQPGLTPIARQFPGKSTPATPVLGVCCAEGGKCVPNAAQWEGDAWRSLQFALDDPHYYSFSYITSDPRASFTARANGDLDCDGTVSTFEMIGQVVGPHRGTIVSNMAKRQEVSGRVEMDEAIAITGSATIATELATE